MLHIDTILVPIDFSEGAKQALDVAEALARDHGSKLVLVSAAVPPAPVAEPFLPDTDYPGMLASIRRGLESLASRIIALPVETHVLGGSPGPSIIALARDCEADLIVMGTHGRSGLSRLLMGSVAEYVLRHAACPVLTIKSGTGSHFTEESGGGPSLAAPVAALL